jgi:hypothetical protein
MAIGREHRKGSGNARAEGMHMAEEWREAGGSFRRPDPFFSRMGFRVYSCISSPYFRGRAWHASTRTRTVDSAAEEIP